MDVLAAHGWDVWLLDVRGYGRSTRPPEMDKPAADNKPIVDTATAARDVGSVVDFVRSRRHVEKLNLMGWSWGTAIMGLYTTTHNANVARLVLYAPGWLSKDKVPPDAPPVAAYRTITREAAQKRWLTGVPEDKKATLIPPGWFDMFADTAFATDPVGAKQDPPVLRAPNGVVQDFRTLLAKRKATVSAFGHHRADNADSCRVGCRSADLPYHGVFRGAEERTLQTMGRTWRGDALRDAGEEPHPVHS